MYFPTGSDWEWNVFNATSCPDPYGSPYHIYSQYEVPFEDEMKIFRRLMGVRDILRRDEIVPKPDNADEIYPELEDLLAKDFKYKK